MAQLTTEGLDDFMKQLNALGSHTTGTTKRCIYDGAAVLAEAVVTGVGGLPVDESQFTPGTDPLRVMTAADKADLAASVGISRIEATGGTGTVSVSFDGYISRTEPKYPGGVPAALIARSIEKGTSVRAKNPFVRRAVNAAKQTVPAAMQASLDESVAYTLEHFEEG